jgi:uncharacterized protein
MHLYTIPYQQKFIIYRPLLRLAFVGNQAMADLCTKIYKNPSPAIKTEEQQAYDFLASIGFLEQDQPFPEASRENGTFQPTIGVLFPTSDCNLRCIYCYAHGGDNHRQTLPLRLARAAIDRVCRNALDQGLEHYSLCFHGGGEPTMAWSLLKESVAYARAKELPANINLTSNGAWTSRKRAWLLDNIDEVSLSFDGPPAVQNRQRPLRNGKASHPLVMKTIHEMDRRSKSYGIRVTITEESIDRIPEIVEYLCQETGAQALQVEPAFNHGRARQDKLAVEANDRFAQAFLAGYDIAHSQQRHMYYSGARPWLLTNRFCEAFNKALIVGPDGFITSCYEVCSRQHELAETFIFGDMDKKGGLALNQQVRGDFLTRIEERRQTCQDCFCYLHCAGDCPSKTFSAEMVEYLVHGDRCRLNQAITGELIIRYILEGQGIWRGDQKTECRIVEPLI